MALEHASLTGAQLHEPKGVETADAGTVYVADGGGSGAWEDPLASLLNQNRYYLTTPFADFAAASSEWMAVPVKSSLKSVTVLLYGAIDANTVLSIYINGVLFADSLTLVAAGSAAGQRQALTVVTSNTIAANSIIELRSAGTATASVKGNVILELEAIA
jgi:hypothetical protein